MNGYSLVIGISSDEENVRRSTPIKTLPVNMVGKANPSDASTEVYRGSDPELDSTFDSGCSPKKLKISPIKKSKRVKFNLPVRQQQRDQTRRRTNMKSLTLRQASPPCGLPVFQTPSNKQPKQLKRACHEIGNSRRLQESLVHP